MKHFILLLATSVVLLSCAKVETYVHGPRPEHKVFNPIWTKDIDPEYQTGNLPVALHSPLIHEGVLYLGHNQGRMQAYELDNGRLIWQKRDKGGYHSAPIIYQDHIIYGTTQGRVFARHYLTGKLKYSIDLGASIESDAVISAGRVFFHLRNHKILCLDVETGKVIWAYKRSVPYLTTLQRASAPLVVGNKLFVGFADGNVAAFSVEEGILIWEVRLSSGSKFVDVDATPVYKNDKLYIASLGGPLTVLEPETGNILRKIEITPSRAPIFEDKVIVVGTTDGELWVLDNQLETVMKKNLMSGPITSMVKWKGNYVVATVGGKIHYLARKDLTEIETYHLGHSASAVFGELKVKDEKLAVLSARNRLYVFR